MSALIDFSDLVRSIRKARSLTQEQLARDLNVTFSTVNCWENGKHKPMPALAARLLEMARAAGIEPRQITTARRRRRSARESTPEGRR